tara:strand:- start:651 stop:872 length:222 start_codon:yes stop_codon:yes gene_type:complete
MNPILFNSNIIGEKAIATISSVVIDAKAYLTNNLTKSQKGMFTPTISARVTSGILSMTHLLFSDYDPLPIYTL